MKHLLLAMVAAIVTGTAVSAQDSSMAVSSVQTENDNGYKGNSANRCGIKFNVRLSGVTKVELESVDGYPLAGNITEDGIEDASSIITFSAAEQSGLVRQRLLHHNLALRPSRRLSPVFLSRRAGG